MPPVHQATSFRVQPRTYSYRVEEEGCTGKTEVCRWWLRGRERKREREREKGGKGCVGADGVRDNTHGTDERVCF